MTNVLCCQGISKSFGATVALKKIDLEIKEGEIFGLLGGNGAGKSTLIRCILQFLNLEGGSILFKEKPITNKDILNYFGFLPENFQPYNNLSGKELLQLLGWGIGVEASKVDKLFEEVSLQHRKDYKIKSYSRGMIQRLGLALCLLKNSQIVVLDEPTLGLDPMGQKQIITLLQQLRDSGKTIFFTSHILSHIEELCDRIGIIHQGTITFVGKIEELLTKNTTTSFREAFLQEII